jgi:hypothetical protein
MKMFIALAFAVVFLVSGTAMSQSCCTPGSKKASGRDTTVSWKTYGLEITLEETHPLAEIMEELNTLEGKEVLICGEVIEVCKGKGCWMVVECGESRIRVEFKDYGFFVPWDSEGKKVKLQGTFEAKRVSTEMAEHMAEEMKQPSGEKGDSKHEQVMTVFVASAVAMERGSEIGEEQRAIIEGKKMKEGHEHKEHVH